MPGILYVVATPIGNLEDVTFRAIRVLREVAVIAAEDTRRTARLLQHYSISTPTTSLHEHNERARTPSLIGRLARGESVALVSDAGTPVVSDPGPCWSLRHTPPASGLSRCLGRQRLLQRSPRPDSKLSRCCSLAFRHLGLSPENAGSRRCATSLGSSSFSRRHTGFGRTLADLLAIFGDRVVAIGRELTKAHEELVVNPISSSFRTSYRAKGRVHTGRLRGRSGPSERRRSSRRSILSSTNLAN